MSLPLKRKHELSCKSTGSAACGSSNVGRGGHTVRGRGNGHGCRCDRGCGRSFNIPSCHASKTVILTEVWKHCTHGPYTISSQSGPAPPSSLTSRPKVESPFHHQSQPVMIMETPQLLHDPMNVDQDHNLGDFVNSLEYQDTPSIHPRKADHPLRQIHQNKQQNQASTWMDQVIPLLLGPFMELLQQTKNGQVAVSSAAPDSNDACSCPSVTLRVTCVSWDRLYFSCSHQSSFN